MPVYEVSMEQMSLPIQSERLASAQKLVIVAPTKDGFKDDEFAHKSDISIMDSVLVSLFFMMIMGGPLVLVCAFFFLLCFGSWTSLFIHMSVTAFLAFHPVPKAHPHHNMHPTVLKISSTIFRYFSYRFMWSGDAWDQARTGKPWIGAGPPHGALPIANLLCMPAINICTRDFVGAPAGVVFNTPFLRYVLLLGSCTVSGSSMVKAIKNGNAVGMVPDGIAGIFTANSSEEQVAIKSRKGLARLMLRTGTALLPAYSIGNTEAFKVWYDSFGVMEWLSRKLKVSIFLPYGRWGLPIPFRCNVTMLFGTPIRVDKVPEGTDPSAEQVDELHQRILDDMSTLFNTHKASLGWKNKTLKFV